MVTPRTTCRVLLLMLLLAPAAGAAPTDDAFIAGYAAAVLEREFALTAPSLRVQGGVITLAASDLATADRRDIGELPVVEIVLPRGREVRPARVGHQGLEEHAAR